MKLKVEVILPVHNGYMQFKKLVSDLCRRQPWPADVRLNILDDQSSDPRIQKLLHEVEQGCAMPVRIFRSRRQRGFVRSVNAMARFAVPGADLLILNSDIRLDHLVISRLRGWLRRDRQIGSVTPLSDIHTVSLWQGPLKSRARIPLSALEINRDIGSLRTSEVVHIPSGLGFCWLIRRKAWEEVGSLWEKLGFGYLDDVEWSIRAGLAGWTHVLAYDCYVPHFGSASFGKQRRQQLILKNFEIVQRRHRFLLDYLRSQNDPDLMLQKWKALMVVTRRIYLRNKRKGSLTVEQAKSLEACFRFEAGGETIWKSALVLRPDQVRKLVDIARAQDLPVRRS